VQTSAKTKRKTGSRPKKQAGTRSRAPAQRKPRRRSDAVSAATRTPSARAKPRRQGPRRPRAPQPTSLYSKDDRNAILLLLAPFVLLLVALGATQVLVPLDALRRQLALLPDPQPMAEVSVAQEVLAGPPPKSIEIAAARLEQISAEPVHDVASVDAAVVAPLQAEPPHDQVAVRMAHRPHRRCVAAVKTVRPPQSFPFAATSATAFGQELASAARAQTRDLVVYSDEYRQIGFPMGDVPRFYGVCTDVVIRAYRALGIDLQVLVHEARIGTGDTSIDHRRTKTLRRFFERYGEKRPVTDFAEDYLPGDIVTYYRASGRTSQTHIAIVSDVIAPSGRPMIVHNRGWGPQLEDALFASDVTGHYRFHYVSPSEQASNGEPALNASTLR
jgi:uncharacterized protein YijF (DUF1287 family)